VAEDVYRALPPDMPAPGCEIYGYVPRSQEGEAAGDSSESPAGTLPLEAPLPAAMAPVDSLQTLFVRPMPPMKRLLDVAGSLLGMVLAAPILLVAAIAIKLTSPGPVLFRQWRSGRGGEPFTMYKLRTMVADAEAQKKELLALSEQDGPAFKLKNDPRLTRVGRILRKLSIDELPQLWNVLKGDMSLVGPRPLPCSESNRCQGWQKARLDVTPGLTCFWQVEGRSRVTFEQWMRLDRRYVSQQSLLADLTLIARTVPAVLRGHGAS
jgi:lipopolysaccharide/colanic/teichoic acid biosynthesis glycosyltransferase